MWRDYAFSLIGIEHVGMTDNLRYLRAFQHSLLVPSHHRPGVQGTGIGRDEGVYGG